MCLVEVSDVFAEDSSQSAASTPAPTSTSSSDSYDIAPYKRFALSTNADYILLNNMSMMNLGSSATPESVSAQFTGILVLGGFTYRPKPNVDVTVYGGDMLGGSLSISGNSSSAGTISENLSFQNAASYGAGLKVDVFPSWRFHLIPSARWIHTDYSGQHVSLSNSTTGCTYDTSTNATSTCVTVGNNTGGGVAQYNFSSSNFVMAMTFLFDVIPDPVNPPIGIFVGAEEAVTILTGGITFQPPGGTATNESYDFISALAETVYAGLSFNLGPVHLGGAAYFFGQTAYNATLGVSF